MISRVLGGLDLRQRAGDVPDPDFVDRAGEEAGGGAGRGQGAADRGERVGGGVGRFADAEGAGVESAVEIEVPGRAVVGRGGVMPVPSAVIAVVPVIGWLRLGLLPLWPSSKSATSLPLVASMPRK